MFTHGFAEATAYQLSLSPSIFTVDSLHCLLQFMYGPSDWAKSIQHPSPLHPSHPLHRHATASTLTSSPVFSFLSPLLDSKKNIPAPRLASISYTTDQDAIVYLLLDVYVAADFLGMNDLCMQTIDLVDQWAHRWTCYCQECLSLYPTLFAATLTAADRFDWLHAKAIHQLTHDPEKALPGFWTQRALAHLLDLASHHPVPRSPSSKPHASSTIPTPLPLMLSRRLCRQVTKSNAIESLHGCFLASQLLAKFDPLVAWSRALHACVASVQAKATVLVTRHFTFYCTQYPALMSCVDGISYSFEFLEYMLMHMLEDQMDLSNCGMLYQGLVRDLICRHSVQYHDHVRHILNVAKHIILEYMLPRIDELQLLGALDPLDTSVLKCLSLELNVPAKQLVREIDRHPDLMPMSLKHILFPSPKITYRRSSSYSRRGSALSMRRTMSVQSGASLATTSHLSVRTTGADGASSPPLLVRFKAWCQSTPSVASFSPVSSPASLFAWASVPLKTVQRQKKSFSWSELFFPKTQCYTKEKANLLVVGKRVKLVRRPVLTIGTVKYLGPVDFAEGQWVGVELDRRVGKNDGSVDGQRYFTTSPNRGVLVRNDDVKVLF
ncbi:hypothetical protein DM01DRAFT_1316518 [Hesseltinella vesiculosa]|uniref:CAP-Gly domain-containing protein n=1 Tax=Hesseltinella vesiculosa TaxID=101127 RepID=A0A1X2GUH9_9FUNG|nr:hypothetical protein DM01DRAFT_1316518 [Hesseltinella vesiculosa]